MPHQTKDISISQIKTKDRFRKDFGDLKSLAESIKQHGLLQAVGVTPKKQLVFGERRLRACKTILKWKKIPVRIVDTESIASAQIDENIIRKNFTVTERVSIVDALHGFEHGGNRRSKNQATNLELESLTLQESCRRVGWSMSTYRNAKAVIENGIADVVEQMDTDDLSISAASELAKASKTDQKACLKRRLDIDRWTAGGIKKQLRRVKSQRSREAALRGSVKRNYDDQFQLYNCKFQDLEKKAKLKPNSASLVAADIPYGSDFGADQVEELAKFSKRFLKNGGTLVCHLGQARLPEKLEMLSKHLEYRWTICSSWDGVGSPIFPINMVNKWIPIAVFSKGKWKPERKWSDVISHDHAEKDWHPWQRNLAEMEEIVSCFSAQKSLVIDPVLGGGTTAIACARQGRRFCGSDIDKAAVINAQKRLKEELEGGPTIIPIGKAKSTKSKSGPRRKVASG